MKSTGRKDVNYKDIWGLFLLLTQFIHWGPELSLNLCLQYEDGGDFQLTFMNRGQDINAWNQQDKSNENKSFFCGFISKLAFEVENQAAPCTNACII